jgi:hypothetical protein
MATRWDQARTWMSRQQWEQAFACMERMLEDDPDNLHWRMAIAERWIDSGRRVEPGLRLAGSVVEESRATAAMRQQAAELVADHRWRSGEVEAALSDYGRLMAEAVMPADRRRLWVRHEATRLRATAPRTHEAVRRAMVSAPPWSDAVVTAGLIDAWHTEGQPVAAYLAGLRLSPSRSPLVGELLAPGVLATLPGDLQRWGTFQRAMFRVRAGDMDGACAEDWPRLHEGAEQGSWPWAESGLWIARCARPLRPVLDPSPAPVE